MQNLAAAGGTLELDYLAVYFDAGAHTRPHTHETDQVLCFLGGSGFVWIADQERQLVEEHGVVVMPAHVVHMHGATESEPIYHLAVRAPAVPTGILPCRTSGSSSRSGPDKSERHNGAVFSPAVDTLSRS